jgi:hypothetical protein
MVGHPHQRHNRKHERKHSDMDRDAQHQQRDDERAADRLNRVKTHRCPSGRRAAVMVHCMRQLEPARAMEQAMRPVKPTIVQQQIDK